MNKSRTATDTALLDLPWVENVHESNRLDAQFTITTNVSAIRPDEHLHDIENLGYTIEEISSVGNYPFRIYVDG